MAELLHTHSGTALPEWIDYNGHLMDGYYFVAFTDATEGLLAHLGFGPAYREQTGCTTYTVEGHINYLHEVKAGARLTYTTQLLGYDAKRLHAFHQMFNEDQGQVAATNELMFLHLNQQTMKVEPMPPDHLEWVAQLHAAQAALPWPAQAGHSIGIPKRVPA